MSAEGARWDWYESTHDDLDDGRVPESLARILGGKTSRGKGRNGYAECVVVERDGAVLAQCYGRSARLGELHVSVSGESCDEVVPVLRNLWPVHRVSRADTAIDVLGDFADIDARALAFAEGRGIKHRLVTDSDGGATRYLGSPSSEVMVRVYKKTEQLRKLHPEAAADVPDGIVRYELQVRPGKRPIKAAVAWMTPTDAWGLSEWSTDFAADMLSISAERASTHFRRPSDYQRGLHFLSIQWGPMAQRRAAEVGSAAAALELLAALGVAS